MRITILNYSYVEPGGPPPNMQPHRTSEEVLAYLDAHVDALTDKAATGSLSPAVFRSSDARDRFNRLVKGTNSQFSTASQALADRLFAGMDQRTKRGFFITLRRTKPAMGAAL